jgi:hypothetical protein
MRHRATPGSFWTNVKSRPPSVGGHTHFEVKIESASRPPSEPFSIVLLKRPLTRPCRQLPLADNQVEFAAAACGSPWHKAAEAMAAIYVSFWGSSGNAWTDGLGCFRG